VSVPARTGWLVLDEPGGRRVPLPPPGGRLRVGRGAGNDVAVPDDDWASRAHAEVVGEGPGVWYLVDLCSSHGTLVDDGAIDRPTRLADRQVVRIGRTAFRVEIPGASGVPGR
jgi:pSer/pThr/pTyr-binding forkhead associated (FHA) protein